MATGLLTKEQQRWWREILLGVLEEAQDWELKDSQRMELAGALARVDDVVLQGTGVMPLPNRFYLFATGLSCVADDHSGDTESDQPPR